MLKIFSQTDLVFYYTDILMVKGKKKKKRIKEIFDIVTFIGLISFYLLKLPFKTVFDILNRINDTNKIVVSSTIYDFSKTLEPMIVENYKELNEGSQIVNKK